MKGISYVIATILMLVIAIALAGTAYMYIAGYFTGTVQGIEIVDSRCERGIVTLTIKNIGTTSISSLNIRQTSPSDDLVALSWRGSIEPGRIINYQDTCLGIGGRSCIYRITPPIGKTVPANAYCTERGVIRICQAAYSMGDFDPDPNARPNLVNDLQNMFGSENVIDGGFVDLRTASQSDVVECTILLMTGHNAFTLTAQERDLLRYYLTEAGGLLFSDDCSPGGGSYSTSLANEINIIFGTSLQTISLDHLIFSSYYTLSSTPCTIWACITPQYLELNGRTIIFHDVNDYFCALNCECTCPSVCYNAAFQMSTNLVVYASGT